MVSLPQSIEAALLEAGFSATEILVLNHLLSEDGMTLRQLASKTGKSTGVLDQAMKKLLRRRIVERQTINDTPKYLVQSLQSIVDWMEQDTQRRREEIDRRYTNFESFVLTLERERARPHFEHFEGFEGIKRAYEKLLECDDKDLCGFVPARCKEEDDPLKDFKVQWFRQRYNKGIFLRVLMPQHALGSRFQSRDPFEYRKTLLIDPKQLSFRLERYVIGNTVACIDYDKRTAMFLHYPEMAKNEKEVFESFWNQNLHAQKLVGIENSIKEQVIEVIPRKTKMISLFREFFISPRSLIALSICTFFAFLFTYLGYQHMLSVSTWRLRDRAVSIAATAVSQFDKADIEKIRTKEDIQKPEYAKLIYLLQQIRKSNTDVAYAYIMRKTSDPDVFTFVADADSLHPNIAEDVNNDGLINQIDAKSFPGDEYRDDNAIQMDVDANGQDLPTSFPALTDQWGTIVNAWAPFKNEKEETVAFIGVDILTERANEITQSLFRPFLIFFGFLVFFLCIRFFAFNPTLKQEILRRCYTKKV